MIKLLSSQLEQFEHGVGDFRSAGFRQFFRQDLVELPLEDFFGPATVKIGGAILCASHGGNQLREQGLADEILEGFSQVFSFGFWFRIGRS